jgi:hypothetical protein
MYWYAKERKCMSKTKTKLPTAEQTSNLFRQLAKKSHEAIRNDPLARERALARLAKMREALRIKREAKKAAESLAAKE